MQAIGPQCCAWPPDTNDKRPSWSCEQHVPPDSPADVAEWLLADSAYHSVAGMPLAQRPVHFPIGAGKEANHAPSLLVSLSKAYGFNEARQAPGFALAPAFQIEEMDDPIPAHCVDSIMASIPQRAWFNSWHFCLGLEIGANCHPQHVN